MGSSCGALRLREHSRSGPFRVLVVGGSYAGLAAALNLQDLCSGLSPRCGPPVGDGDAAEPQRFDIDITIVDERDGYCMSHSNKLSAPTFLYLFDVRAIQS